MSGVSFPELDLFVPVSRDDILIDAGANIGDIASRFARTGATVHAFEPNRSCFEIIKRRFAALPNVKPHHLGVMDRRCTLTLSTPKPHAQFDGIDTTVASSFVASHDEAETETVECIDLSEFIYSLPRPVALLKMDIEGAEVQTINRLIDTGAIERVNMAVVETHERFSPELAVATDELRDRIASQGLSRRVRLDWI